jgi:hypothetical protein
MARRQWLIMGWLAATGLNPNVAAAEPVEMPGVVVQIVNLAQVDGRQLTVAKNEVERIFRAAGVEITWTVGPVPVPASVAAQHGGPRPHVVLFVADAQGPQTDRDDAAGEAWRQLGRAYAFHDRIRDACTNQPTDPALVLGRVMAHEIGHLLLPSHSHSAHGIMRPNVDFNAIGLFVFEPEQARTIRTELLTHK